MLRHSLGPQSRAAATCHFGTLAHLLTISVNVKEGVKITDANYVASALVPNRERPYLPAASNSEVVRADQSDCGKQRAAWHGGSNAGSKVAASNAGVYWFGKKMKEREILFGEIII